jgi:hypothetical protein
MSPLENISNVAYASSLFAKAIRLLLVIVHILVHVCLSHCLHVNLCFT